MRLPTIVAVVAAAGLMGLARPAAVWAQPPSGQAAELAEQGDRFFDRGDWRTAIKLYQAAGKTLSAADMTPRVAFRLGVAHFRLGSYQVAAETFRLAVSVAATPQETGLARLYLAYSLARTGREGEAQQLVKAAGGPPESERPALESGLLLAESMASAGDRAQAMLFLDRLYREEPEEEAGRRIAARFGAVATAAGASDVLALVRQGRLTDPSRGVVLPWLRSMMEGGMAAESRVAIGVLEAFSGDESFSRGLDSLGRRAEAIQEHREIKVGVLVPLSGSYQFFGRRILQAYQLALDRLGDPRVTLAVRDTGGDPELAAAAARELAAVEGVKVILGPLLSSEAEAVIKVLEEKRIPALSPAAQSQGLTALSRWFFRNSLTLRQQGADMARAAVLGFGIRDFAVLSPDDNYGRTMARAFWDELLALGGRVVHSAEYGADQTDFGREIRQLRGDAEVKSKDEEEEEEESWVPPFEAVYIPDTYNRVGLLAPQLSFHDIDRAEALLLGGSGLNTPDFVRIGEDYVEGAVLLDAFLVSRPDPAVQEFAARYRRRFGEAPDVMSAQGYDAAGMVLGLIRGGRLEPEEIRSGLASLREYRGVCGPTSMGPDREAIRPPVYITVFHGRLVELVLEERGP